MYRKEEYSTLVWAISLLTKKRQTTKLSITTKQRHVKIVYREYFKDSKRFTEIKIPYRTHNSRLPVKHLTITRWHRLKGKKTLLEL